jgi:hypothetical protein
MATKSWLPKEEKVRRNKEGVRLMTDGEPLPMTMVREVGDDFVSCSNTNSCCGCGMRHLRSFELRKKGQRYILTERAWTV